MRWCCCNDLYIDSGTWDFYWIRHIAMELLIRTIVEHHVMQVGTMLTYIRNGTWMIMG